jgi:protein involved in temperature-dependent protein secretion
MESGSAPVTGLGQRMLATDSSEYPLMDIRQIVLDHANG